MWEFASYVISSSPVVANNVAHMYLALTQGEGSFISSAAVHLWDGEEEKDQAATILERIRKITHPVFGPRDSSDITLYAKWTVQGGISYTCLLYTSSGNGKTYIACALGNAACRRFKKVAYIRMPELLDEITIARSSGELKKLLAAYKKVDLLILDEWLIRPLSPQEAYDLLEIVEARCKRSMLFCTQYQPEGWYTRIDPNPESDSPVSEAIMDRIIHNSYEIMVEGRISMRERKGLKASAQKGSGED